MPTLNPANMRVATPEPFSVPEPMATPLLSKLTVPVGIEPFWAVTVAVIVTTWPKFEGFGALVRTVVVGIRGIGDNSKTTPPFSVPPRLVVP